MLLANATWEEINGLDRNTVVLIPFGAMEQHGLHLPMKTDSAIAAEIVERIDQRLLNDVLVLPVQWAGYSPHHMDFAGSITLTAETYIRVAIEIIGSLAKAGFLRFLLLNAHGGNRAILDVAANELKFQFPAASFVTATYWNVARTQIQAIRESKQGGLGHACEMETSMLLAAYPKLVRIERAIPDGAWPCSEFLAKDMLSGGDVSIASAFAEFTKSGTNGDPTTATAEKGEAFLNAIVQRLIDLISEYQSGKLHEMKPVKQ